MMTWKPLLFCIATLFFTAMATACGTTPVNRYYTLVNHTQAPAAVLDSSCSRPIVVASVMADSPYEENKIVFRSDAYEVRYFNYRHWVKPPAEMIEALIRRRLEVSGLFAAVEHQIHSSSDHLGLYANIHAIEEIDREDKWVARLAMSLMLKNAKDEQIVWKYDFDAEKEVPNKDLYSVVETLSMIYNKQMNLAVESLEKFTASYANCR